MSSSSPAVPGGIFISSKYLSNLVIMDSIVFNMTAFCGTVDFSTWDTKKLNFGMCFQKSVIIVPVFALLAITSSYYIGRQSEWVVRRRKQMAIIQVRIVVTILSLLLAVLHPLLFFYVGHGRLYWVDGLVVGVKIVSWLLHLGYLSSLKTRLSVGTRGPNAVIFAWLLTFLCTINFARTTWYSANGTSKLIEYIVRYMALTQMCVQIVYLFTLFPKGSGGVSQYHELHREANEATPLMETSYNDYSGFHEAADPYHLGIAEERVNMLSYLTFHWVTDLMVKGSLGHLRTQDDLHDLPLQMHTDVIAQKVHKTMMISQPLPSDDSEGPDRHQKYSFLKVLHKCFGLQFYSIGLLKLTGDALGFAGPLLLHELVTFIMNKDEDAVKGYIYAGGLCGAALVATFCTVHFNYLLAKVNLRVRAAVISTVYRKVLQVSTANLSRFSTGEVVNMMSTDTDRIVNFCQSFHALWSLPLQLCVTLYLLYQQIGIAFLAGVAVTIILIPINKWLASKIARLSVQMMAFKDRRVGLMKEVLSMIKMVKLSAWEGTFKCRIYDERYGEVKALAGRKYLDAACVYFWAATPVLIPIVTFSVYIALGNPLDPARVFTAVALFNMLIMPLNAFPWVINGMVEAWVSLRRVERLMELPEQDLVNYYTVVPEMSHKDSELQVLITSGNFTWNGVAIQNEQQKDKRKAPKSSPTETHAPLIDSQSGSSDDEAVLPALRRINMQLSKGQVVAIVGRVGSGKTSLLNVIMAEMIKIHGVVAVAALHSGFGLASQQPWIQNGSIKDNILFGSSLDTTRYRTVLSVCALDEDLHGFALRDNKLCGENGSSLSGGQKARVALARAVYQNKSIYLLDDILSAVDEPVARHIMRHCIHGFLAGKTVLLATNNINLLTKADWIISVKNGEILSQGPPAVILPNLLSSEELSDDWWDEVADSQSAVIRRPSLDIFATGQGKSTDPARKKENENEEERDYGELSSAVYYTYITAVGVVLTVGIFFAIVLMQGSRNLTDMWLAYWVSQTAGENSTGFTTLVHEVTAPWMGTGTRPDPPKIVSSLSNSMQWFAPITPVHKFLATQEVSQFSSEKVDPSTKFYLTVYGTLAASNSVFTLMRAFLFAYGGICAAKALHKRLLDAVLYAKISFFDNNPLGRILNRFSSDLYTVDDSLPFQMNIFFAQVFGFIGSVLVTIYGMPWIILLYIPLAFVYYTVQSFYRHTSRDLKRLHAVSLSPLYAHFTETLQGLPVIRAMRAVHRFSVRADSLLEVSQRAQFDIQIASQWLNLRLQLIGLAMLAGVSVLALLQHHFDAIDAGLVGLVISYALTISSYLNSVVGSLTETERELVSVERFHQYLEGTEPEKREGITTPPFGWPSHGSIKFQNVYLRYQLVLLFFFLSNHHVLHSRSTLF